VIIKGDCIAEMQKMPTDSVDLVFGSPPYEDARTYGIDFKVKGQDWVDWMVAVYIESLRVCKGLVAYVVAGRTRKFAWSCTPALLIADLHRAGIAVREGPYYHRVGIPGSGGPDWLRHDLEFIVCATNGGRLPWSDNKVMGHKPVWPEGGPLSHRTTNGERINQKSRAITVRQKDGSTKQGIATIRGNANPGCLISVGSVGGGQIGSKLAHENEAPFPEKLAEFMIRSFCPPGGITLDPFCGSGTTGAAAVKAGRKFIGIDVRASQVALTYRRLSEARQQLNLSIEES